LPRNATMCARRSGAANSLSRASACSDSARTNEFIGNSPRRSRRGTMTTGTTLMNEDPASIRAQAKHCRSVASRMHTPSSREMLEQIARELDDDALRLETEDLKSAMSGTLQIG